MSRKTDLLEQQAELLDAIKGDFNDSMCDVEKGFSDLIDSLEKLNDREEAIHNKLTEIGERMAEGLDAIVEVLS